MSSEHDRIGPTAHYTAHVWQRLRLPYAELFATRRGAALYWAFFFSGEWMTRIAPGVPSMREYLEYRHRLIEAVLHARLPDRIVDLGAGLSRRGITWAADRGVECIDVDLPTMAAAKRRALEQVPAELRARLRVVDDDVLSPGFEDRLAALLAGAERPVVTAEGLLSYFDPPDRQQTIATVADALRHAGGGSFVCDVHTAEDQARVGRAAELLRLAIRTVTRRKRALDPFPTRAALHEAFEQAGFDAAEIVDAREHDKSVPQLRTLHSPALVVEAHVRGAKARGAGAP
jgi:O-methyltransferase involved in polyketide biosynthesis